MRTAFRTDTDQILVACSVALIAVSMIGSATTTRAFSGAPLMRYMMHLLLGSGLALWLSRVSLSTYYRFANAAYLIALILLLQVAGTFGMSQLGVRRWVSLGSFYFAPGEWMHLATLLLLAKQLAQPKGYPRSRWGPIQTLGVLFFPCLLFVLQPDLSNAALLVIAGAPLIVLSSGRVSVIVAAALTPMLLLLVTLLLFPYQWDRLQASLPFAATTHSYQVHIALEALRAGGVVGVGFGRGVFKNFLPGATHEFMIPALGEEFGFVGVLVIIGLETILLARLWRASASATSYFPRLFASGVLLLFATRLCLNLGMTIGIVPPAWLGSPLLGRSGTHLVVDLASIGIVVGVTRRPAGYPDYARGIFTWAFQRGATAARPAGVFIALVTSPRFWRVFGALAAVASILSAIGTGIQCLNTRP